MLDLGTMCHRKVLKSVLTLLVRLQVGMVQELGPRDVAQLDETSAVKFGCVQ